MRLNSVRLNNSVSRRVFCPERERIVARSSRLSLSRYVRRVAEIVAVERGYEATATSITSA